jgi:hypothetical protein
VTLHSLIDSTEALRETCFKRNKEGKCAALGVEITVAEYIRAVSDGDADDDDLLEFPALTSYVRAAVCCALKALGGAHFKAQSAEGLFCSTESTSCPIDLATASTSLP